MLGLFRGGASRPRVERMVIHGIAIMAKGFLVRWLLPERYRYLPGRFAGEDRGVSGETVTVAGPLP